MSSEQTVFSQILDFIPKHQFRACVNRYNGNYRVKSFSCFDQYLTMAFAQLTYRENLRDIETCLRALHLKLYRCGFHGTVSCNNLANANEKRDWRIYHDFAQVRIQKAPQLYADEDFDVTLKNTVYALDATVYNQRISDMQKNLRDFKPAKEFFIGIDSDGCVFDTMEIKHKECFCPNVIKYFNLQPISKYVRQTWDFVNLYSDTRGSNRFIALLRVFDLLRERKEVIERKVKIMDLSPLADWVKKETKLGNPALEAYAKQVSNPVIERVLSWTKAVNASIADMVHGIGPYPHVRESLDKLNTMADAIVVSQTPIEAISKEWSENDIKKYVKLIAGQEHGSKEEHIRYAAKNKYPENKILMIGDAPGDCAAAKANGAMFYPINPGNEEESWKRFYQEGVDKFFTGKFEGDYQQFLIEEFKSYLPAKPPWK